MGKKHREGGPTRETQRMGWLFKQLLGGEKWTKTSIAKAMGFDRSYVNWIMDGERDSIGADLVSRAQEAFDVHYDYFYEEYEGERDHAEYPASKLGQLRALKAKVATLENQAHQETQVRKRR